MRSLSLAWNALVLSGTMPPIFHITMSSDCVGRARINMFTRIDTLARMINNNIFVVENEKLGQLLKCVNVVGRSQSTCESEFHWFWNAMKYCWRPSMKTAVGFLPRISGSHRMLSPRKKPLPRSKISRCIFMPSGRKADITSRPFQTSNNTPRTPRILTIM